jgi:PleD family two-component response regulator
VLKLISDEMLSSLTVDFNLRPYNLQPGASPAAFRVLLAEDTRSTQLVISRLLKALGVDVTVVDDGSVAVEKLVNERAEFNLAIFDISMPIMVWSWNLGSGSLTSSQP